MYNEQETQKNSDIANKSRVSSTTQLNKNLRKSKGTCPLLSCCITGRLDLAMNNLHTEFEMHSFVSLEDRAETLEFKVVVRR